MEISIIIPVYNSANYLRLCLDSVFAQTYKDFEVICVNDGSSDESLQILQEYGKQHKNLSIYTIENGGQANARNFGISKATGTNITFVDSDDTLHVDLLKKLHHKIIEFDADMAFCDIDRIFKDNKKSPYQYDTMLHVEKATNIHNRPDILCYLHGAPYGKLIRRKFLCEHNISFLKGYIYEDQAFTQLILSYNPKIVQVEEKLYQYYIHANSTMTATTSNVMDMFTIYDFIFQSYEKQGLSQTFNMELQYLCLYHVLVGTSFRLWKSKQKSLYDAIVMCRKFVRKYKCKRTNPYLKEKGLITRIFVFMFA